MISTLSAALVLGAGSLAFAAPAEAFPMNHSGFQQQDQYIGNYCDHNPNAGQCNDWRTNHTRWGNSQYQGFYRNHQNDQGFGGNVVAGLFGLAIGAAVTGAVINSSNDSDHVRACQSAYRSYEVSSDTYLGFDGVRHVCRS